VVVRLVVVVVTPARRLGHRRGGRVDGVLVWVTVGAELVSRTFRRRRMLLRLSVTSGGGAELAPDEELFVERMLLGGTADAVKNRRVSGRKF